MNLDMNGITNGPCFVYVDYTVDKQPFYVGVGNLARVRNKRRTAWHSRHAAKHGHIRKIIDQGVQDVCFDFEKLLIAELGRIDNGTGCLLNMTDGGDGTFNLSPSALKKRNAKIAASHGTSLARERTAATSRKMHADGLFKEKHAIAVKAGLSTESSKLKRALSAKKMWQDPEYRRNRDYSVFKTEQFRQKMQIINAERSGTDKAKANMSRLSTARWKTAEYRAKFYESRTDDVRFAMGASSRGHVWVTNGVSELRIKSGGGLPEGFNPGRAPRVFSSNDVRAGMIEKVSAFQNLPESKEKMRAVHQGTRWANNGVIAIKVRDVIPDGFVLGRIKRNKEGA